MGGQSVLEIKMGVVTPCIEGKKWWARQDSNLQQHGYEPWVLTN